MNDNVRILLIDDNPDDRALVMRELAREFPNLTVEQINEAEGLDQALEVGNFDLVITDYQLRWTDGLAILRAVKANWPDCLVIMFTATGSEEIAVEAMKAGLDDYVLKSPKHLIRLSAAVRLSLKRAQEYKATKEAQARYQRLFDGVPVGLYRTTPEGQILEINPAFVEMMGYLDEEDLLAINVSDLYVNPEERRQWQVVIEREGVVRGYELQFRRRDGTIIWAMDSARAVCDTEGRVLYYEGSVEDITARKQAEEQIQRQLKRLAALHSIDMAITASMSLHVTLNILLDQTTTELDVGAADVLLFNPHIQTLEYAAGCGFKSDALRSTRLRLGQGHAGRAALERRLVNVPNLAEVEDDHTRALKMKGEAFVAYYGVPLIAKGKVVGVLEVFHRAPLDPDPEWLDFLETLAAQAAIAINNAQLFDNLQRSNLELALAYEATLEGWSHALDLRDKETEGHTQRVTELTMRLARTMEMSENELVHVRRGALLHDIGKMGIPDSILHKPGPLDDEEWDIMRRHPEHAFELLSPIAYLRPALEIPYCHHEKWDGTGYPRGLKEEQIPLAARIFAVVDVWDALCSERPYREAWTEEKALEYIQEQAGKHFDPQVVEAFLKILSYQKDEL